MIPTTVGMNTLTGYQTADLNHLQQSVADVLFTPIGSRVMRRNYGSHLFELIDQAANDSGRMRVIAASAEALLRWEPRLALSNIQVSAESGGRVCIEVRGKLADDTPQHLSVAYGGAS
ncbi:GPW/gp25 family protein [Veronia nyctiphanis]|nr:GPW/gp25 family protein [Veronia nyctiphanis]